MIVMEIETSYYQLRHILMRLNQILMIYEHKTEGE